MDPLLAVREDSTSDTPRWMHAKGVTQTGAREHELGQGKWTAAARPLEEVAREMGSLPVRELEIREAGPPWGGIILGALVLAGVAWWFTGDPEPTAQPTAEPVAQPVQTLPAATEAVPDVPRVTVVTDPPSALVYLDGFEVGVAPVLVPVPTDSDQHRLCVEAAGQTYCRDLTGETLALQDPYTFAISDLP